MNGWETACSNAGGDLVLFEDDIFKIEISLEKSIEAESADKINESADKPPINFELKEQEQLIKEQI